MKRTIGNLALVVFSILVSLVLAEFAARFLPQTFYYWENRFLFYSSHALRNVGTYWEYVPNTWVRSAAVYGFPCSDYHVEYDVWFRTNDIGLVQTRNFDRSRNSIAVFGDSFTEGQGATPWFYRLEEEAREWTAQRSLQLLNVGHQSVGVPYWHDMFFEKRDDLNLTKAIFVLIGSDWSRKRQVWSESDIRCINDSSTCNPSNTWHGMNEKDLSWDGMIAAAKRRAAARHGEGFKSCVKGLLARHSRIYKYVQLYSEAYLGSEASRTSHDQQFLQNGVMMEAMLRAIGMDNVAFVIVPVKDEAERGRFNAETEQTINAVRGLGVTNMTFCELGKQDFYRWDGHPNQAGYDKLATCTYSALQSLSSQNE